MNKFQKGWKQINPIKANVYKTSCDGLNNEETQEIKDEKINQEIQDNYNN